MRGEAKNKSCSMYVLERERERWLEGRKKMCVATCLAQCAAFSAQTLLIYSHICKCTGTHDTHK